MNKQRRKALSLLIDKIEALRPMLEELGFAKGAILQELEDLLDAEQEAFDNLPESLQTDDKQSALDSLTAARDQIEALEFDLDIENTVRDIDDARGPE